MPHPLVIIIALVLAIASYDAMRWVKGCMQDPDYDYTVFQALTEWWFERVMRLFRGDGGGNGGGPRIAG